MQLSQNDLMIIKDSLEHKWEEYRPEGDETDLYERVLAKIDTGSAEKG